MSKRKTHLPYGNFTNTLCGRVVKEYICIKLIRNPFTEKVNCKSCLRKMSSFYGRRFFNKNKYG